MHLDLIVGLALDYYSDLKYSFEEVFKLFAPELQLGFLKFLKGTPVRDKYHQHGFVFDQNPPYQIISSNYLSETELHNITLLEHALEIYWNKKRTIHTLKYVTVHYSIFDFLMGLGTYFISKKEAHKYTLKDVYELIYDFAKDNYADDFILQELIAVDYYLQQKIKPQQLFIKEAEISEKNILLQQLNLNPNKFRFVILPLSFDFDLFKQENKILKTPAKLIIQYSGVTNPEYTCLPFHQKAILSDFN
jgi:hypothetical protein